jgi:two-component system response regulator PrrA
LVISKTAYRGGAGAGHAPVASGRVLVVDDDERIVAVVCEALEMEGYEVVAARDGAAALDILWQSWDRQPDVILLDMRMPALDGSQFVEAYRMLPVPQAPIVVMTAARRAEASAVRVCADGVLPKPFDLGDLLERVYRLRRHATGGPRADQPRAAQPGVCPAGAAGAAGGSRQRAPAGAGRPAAAGQPDAMMRVPYS